MITFKQFITTFSL